jgi:CheY-like chemotaxis protein
MDQLQSGQRAAPRASPKAAKRDGAAAISTGYAGRGALLIATDAANRQMCRRVLEENGLRVNAVDSGVAAVVAARALTPDIVCIDAQLRDVPARSAIAWLRSNPPLATTPIIVLIASQSDKVALASLAHNVILFAPVSPDMIRNAVVKTLGRPTTVGPRIGSNKK